VLVKGSAHLENLGRLQVVAFDKTGTLTHGRPEVTDVIAFQPESFTSGQVLSLAAALEARSGHPLAQAVLRAAAERGTALLEVGAVESLNGRGLRSTYLLQAVLCGSQRLIDSVGISLPQEAAQKIAGLEAQGKTTMLVALGAKVVGLIALADTLRPDIQSTLSTLARVGVARTVMISGDNRRVAEAAAQQVGIHEVYADLLPEDKAAVVQSLAAKYGMVGMVGDGVNDAPALATAAVGIAMGGAATDVALETADVALMSSNLQRLPFAIGLGRATRRVIIQNLAIASVVILLLGVSAISGAVGIGLAVFFHEGSTILVVLNAMRLLGYRG
jgi:Cd2+/Zn2+-exporting ATPase